MREKKKVVVAMSGGIDSSVAALLLKKEGYEPIGIFMKFWKEGGGKSRCCFSASERIARTVAKKINIPFYIFDLRRQFKKIVIDYFLSELKKGNTPNPCVICNEEIKFGLLLEKALSLGADFISTGHYAKIKIRNFKIKGKNIKIYQLFRAKDNTKDQSYFLWRLKQNQLKHILFPLSDLTKREVKKIAEKFNLPVSNILESQELCFISGRLEDFLKKHIKPKKGDIIDKEGKILGNHKGIWFYTIGQRKGIGLPGGPYYVIKKDFKKNLLVVSKDKRDLLSKNVFLKDVNFIGNKVKLPLLVKAKIRYKQKEGDAILKREKNRYLLSFENPQMAITPGQSAVFYQNKRLIGGGIIC